MILNLIVGNTSSPRLGRACGQPHGVAPARAAAGRMRRVPRPTLFRQRRVRAARRAVRAHRPAEHPRFR